MKKWIINSIILVLALLMGAPIQAHAAKISLSSKILTKEAEKAYKKGDLQVAINKFSKALLADPSNEKARTYLEDMGVDRGFEYPYQLSPAMQVASFSHQLKASQNKVSELESQNASQKAVCDQLEADNNVLCRQVEGQKREIKVTNIKYDLIKDNFEERASQDFKKIQKLKDIKDENTGKINTITRVVERQKRLAQKRNEAITTQNEHIDILYDRIDLARNALAKESYNFEDRVVASENKYRDAILNLKGKITSLENNSSRNRKKNSKAITTYKRALRKQEKELDGLRDELALARQTLESQDEMEKMFGSAEPLSENVKDKIAIIKQKDADIALLKEQLVKARRQITDLERSQTSLSDVPPDRKKLAAIQRELDAKEEALRAKDEDISILEKRLSDAKERLGFVQEIIDSREETIKELQDQVSAIQSQCQ